MADRTQTPAAPHVYQEGSVDSIRERPTETDRSDRTGQAETTGAPPRAEGDGRRDEFISSEVSDRTSRPMRDSKTQS
jgi:hypothetical protein